MNSMLGLVPGRQASGRLHRFDGISVIVSKSMRRSIDYIIVVMSLQFGG
jgi:hypothetical protein